MTDCAVLSSAGENRQREKGGEVSEHIDLKKLKTFTQTSLQDVSVANITANSNKGVQLVGTYHGGLVTAPVIEVSSFQWREIWPATLSRFHSTHIDMGSICVQRHQEAIHFINVQQTEF